MKYLCSYSWDSYRQNQAEGIRRFREFGNRPPQGVTLIGRWTRADFKGGVALVESNDAKAMTEFALQWSDIMEIDVAPALEDMELVEVLERVKK